MLDKLHGFKNMPLDILMSTDILHNAAKASEFSGSIKQGMVTEIQGSKGVALISCFSDGGVYYATWTSNTHNSSYGLFDASSPVEGSKVIFTTDNTGNAYIIGELPFFNSFAISYQWVFGPEYNLRNYKTYKAYEDEAVGKPANDGLPLDLFPGDKYIVNGEGAGLSVLRGGLASIFASSFCSVECISIDDLVRISSNTYEHYNATGQHLNFNDGGRTSGIIEISSIWLDTLGGGTDEKNSSVFPFINDYVDSKDTDKLTSVKVQTDYTLLGEGDGSSVDFVSKNNEDSVSYFAKLNKIPIVNTNLVVHYGYIAGQFKMWVTRRNGPNQTEEQYDNESALVTGLAEIHIGTEGEINIRSVEELLFERSDKINPPIKLKEYYEDDIKNYVKASDWEWPNAIANNESVAGKGLNATNYSLYLHNIKGLERYSQQPEKWKVIKEDRGEVQESQKLHLRKDGSIYLEDKWGSSIEMSNGNIRIKASNDIEMEAGNNITAVAGNDISNRAKGNVALTADTYGIKLHAKRDVLVLAEDAGVLIESKADNLGDGISGGVTTKDGYGSNAVTKNGKKIWNGETQVSHGVVVRTRGDDSFFAIDSERMITACSNQGDFCMICEDYETGELKDFKVLAGNIFMQAAKTNPNSIIAGAPAATGDICLQYEGDDSGIVYWDPVNDPTFDVPDYDTHMFTIDAWTTVKGTLQTTFDRAVEYGFYLPLAQANFAHYGHIFSYYSLQVSYSEEGVVDGSFVAMNPDIIYLGPNSVISPVTTAYFANPPGPPGVKFSVPLLPYPDPTPIEISCGYPLPEIGLFAFMYQSDFICNYTIDGAWQKLITAASISWKLDKEGETSIISQIYGGSSTTANTFPFPGYGPERYTVVSDGSPSVGGEFNKDKVKDQNFRIIKKI